MIKLKQKRNKKTRVVWLKMIW